MIITKDEMFSEVVPPELQDRAIAARTSSLFCWMAALWFFVSPWAYFGVSEQSSAWNAWIVGGIMIVASLARLIDPLRTASFSVINAVLSIWVLISPFVFGFTNETNRMINTLSIGAVTLGFSIQSLMITKDDRSRIGTSDVYEE